MVTLFVERSILFDADDCCDDDGLVPLPFCLIEVPLGINLGVAICLGQGGLESDVRA